MWFVVTNAPNFIHGLCEWNHPFLFLNKFVVVFVVFSKVEVEGAGGEIVVIKGVRGTRLRHEIIVKGVPFIIIIIIQTWRTPR